MRLLTRSDFDGLVCAALLAEKGVVDTYAFVHPKDVQDGQVPVTSDDVLANIPFAPGCGLWFDHHMSERARLDGGLAFEGACEDAPSAAQVIWDYYGGVATFGDRLVPLLEAANKVDSGDLTAVETISPEDWVLLAFIMDPRTGIERYGDYRIRNDQLMVDMIGYCRTKPVAAILEVPDVRERVDRYHEQQGLFMEMLKQQCRIVDNVIVTDLRQRETLHAGNRFLIYALYPEQNIEIRVMWGKDRRNVVFMCGHSVVNRTSKTDVGRLMLEYGGGGHARVGTCQVAEDVADDVLDELVEAMCATG